MKSLIYKFHRRVALLACVPVIAWTFSGICHPVMGWLSPEPKEKNFKQPPLDADKFQVPLRDALTKNLITEFSSARVINFDNDTFYRISVESQDPIYISASTAAVLPNGETRFAEILARHFVGDPTSPIQSIQYVPDFTSEYREIFQFAPAYVVQFERPDNMRAYVDPSIGRLGMLSDATRSRLLFVFTLFHNWQIPGVPEIVRVVALLIFSGLVACGGLSGLFIYALMGRRLGKGVAAKTAVGRTKTWHRRFGLTFSLVMLLFAFSGCYHAFYNFSPDHLANARSYEKIATSQIAISPAEALMLVPGEWTPINLAVVGLHNKPHYLLTLRSDNSESPNESLMIDATTSEIVEDGDIELAEQVVRKLNQNSDAEKDRSIASSERRSSFGRDYPPVFKRIPVVKVTMARDDGRHYFVSPDECVIVRSSDNVRRWELLSFTFLHKWHFLDLFGATSNVRNVVMVFCTAGCTAVSLLGMALLLRKKQPAKRLEELREEAAFADSKVQATSAVVEPVETLA